MGSVASAARETAATHGVLYYLAMTVLTCETTRIAVVSYVGQAIVTLTLFVTLLIIVAFCRRLALWS